MNIVERYNLSGYHIRYNTRTSLNNGIDWDYLIDARVSYHTPSGWNGGGPGGSALMDKEVDLIFSTGTNASVTDNIRNFFSSLNGFGTLEIPIGGVLGTRCEVVRNPRFINMETNMDHRSGSLITRIRLYVD